MANYEIAKAKIEATAMMCKSFYTDFMPMIQRRLAQTSTQRKRAIPYKS